VATLSITLTNANGDAGALLRRLGEQIQNAAAGVPDRVPTGGSVVCVIDNAPAAGSASVQITGPYGSNVFYV
jgi:hypothetical protein